MYIDNALPPVQWPDQSSYSAIAGGLLEKGWHKQEAFLPFELMSALKMEIDRLSHTELTPAGIGKGRAHRLAKKVRRDKTCWLNGNTEPQKDFFNIAEQLRLYLNRELFLGLFDFEAHYAVYAPGAFYRKHLDVFRDESARRISSVYYLNEDWQEFDGGELVLYHPEENRVLERIAPRAGTLVTFISNRFYHEVLPARTLRYSIAGWYRVNTSIQGVIDPPR